MTDDITPMTPAEVDALDEEHPGLTAYKRMRDERDYWKVETKIARARIRELEAERDGWPGPSS